jgi:methylglutaconyl-CoA hydratase
VTDVLVGVEHGEGVRTLSLDSPANRNALSALLLAQLEEALRDAIDDPDVRAIVLTGTGTVFCSGADLSERGAAARSRMPAILTSMVESAVPVIVRVNGHARAGGLGLIAAADMAVAAEASTFAFSEVRVGVAPAMILVPALRVVDRRFLARAALTGARFGASEAAAAGLLTAVTPDDAALDAWVADQTTAIRQAAPGAVQATKHLLRSLPAQAWNEGLAAAASTSAQLFAGAEAAEGMDAFLQKRRPSWDTTA